MSGALDDHDQADVFAIPDFWQMSRWLDQLPLPQLETPFFDASLKSKETNSGFLKLDALPTNKDGLFQLPAFDSAHGEDREETPVSEGTSEQVDTVEDTTINTNLDSDVWMELRGPTKKKPGLRTWDSFLSGKPSDASPIVLTEAGPSVYDALLSWQVDSLELKNVAVPEVDAKTYFSALLALALGRESVLFVRDGKRKDLAFRPALPHMRISGYSSQVLKGLEKQSLTCGLTFLQLQAFAQRTYSRHSTKCGVALASAIDEVLRAVQQHVVLHAQNPRSLLQLQDTIQGTLAVLDPFKDLIDRLPRSYSDKDVMSLVFERASTCEGGEQWLCDTMQRVLQQVSRPWIDFLEMWIGTKREEGIPFNKTSVGESRGFVKVEAEVFMDDFGQEVENIDFRIDRSRIPSFMPDEVIQLAFETGRNLRFIRDTHPSHPLVRAEALSLSKPPTVDWAFKWDDILLLEARVVEYRGRLVKALDGITVRPVSFEVSRPDTVFRDSRIDILGLDLHGIESRIMASMERLDASLPQSGADDDLGLTVRQRLCGIRQPATTESNATPHWSLSPVLSFGSIVSAQAKIVNQETLRLLIEAHDLRGHLELQRNYHLLGDGLFCSRLSHALFDPDLETAEREVGVAQQGGIMGLRLGGRKTWPPASSELRLALMGVLADSYHAQQGTKPYGRASIDSSDLPGDLSFAVRDLSDEEINKCMDPDSLEALDFLRLSYKTPPELSFVMTPAILTRYDRIFRLLLRVLRMIYVVGQLWRDVNRSEDEDDEMSYRFVREAYQFVTSVAGYIFDTGIAVPWQAFESKLDEIQRSLNKGAMVVGADNVESPEQLQEYHSNVLQSIMLCLFLRKRQEPVLKLLEDTFGVILQFARFARLRKSGERQPSDDPSHLYSLFKRKVQIFITVCKGLAEKSQAGQVGDGIGDESMIAQLVMKLDMNQYYSKH